MMVFQVPSIPPQKFQNLSMQIFLRHPLYIATKVSGKSSNSPSASLRAKQLLKLPPIVASWAAWLSSTASLHAIAWRHAVGTSVSTTVVGRPWPAAFPPEHGKPAGVRASSRYVENTDLRKKFL